MSDPIDPWLSADLDKGSGNWIFFPYNIQWQTDLTYSISARVTDAAGNQAITGSMFVYTQGIIQQALTRLTMEVSSQAILQDQTLSVTGKFSRLPDTSINLSGRPLDLTVSNPDGDIVGTYHTSTYDQYGHYRFNSVRGFISSGEYQVRVSFEQTLLLAGSSTNTKVQVSRGSGYAILIQGVGVDDPGFESYTKSAGQIYHTLINKGFSKDSVQYFSDEDNPTEVDDIPSKEKIGQAIETWAKDKIQTASAPLYVIMVGHGDQTGFLIDKDTETISPSDLNGWLNNLQDRLDSASKSRQIILIGSNYSGSFIPVLSAPDRVVITSCDADEMAVMGPKELDGTHKRVSDLFFEEFLKEAGKGVSIKDAFLTAAQQIKIYTRMNNQYGNPDSRYTDNAIQHPLLDDNADGKGGNRLIYDGDGDISQGLYIGTGVIENFPRIINVTDTQYIGLDQSSVDLWMKADVDNQAISWLEIRSPSLVLSPEDGFEHRTIDLIQGEMAYNDLMDQWGLTWDGFNKSGKYELFYYVRNPGDETLFSMSRSVVYKNKYGNTPPQAFDLVVPLNESEQTTLPVFDWEAALDTDEDTVTYNLIIATDVNFHNIVLRREEIAFPPIRIDDPFILKDLTNYYWKIEAVDSFGSVTYSSSQQQFNTNNTNGFHTYIMGQIINSLNLTGIVGANIKYGTKDFGVSTFHPAKPALYWISHAAGTYQLEVTANSFQESSESITGVELGGIIHDVYLEPLLVNKAPVISNIKDLTIFENTATNPIPFIIGDMETAVDQLVITMESSNISIVPNDKILISGTGSNRTVKVTPLPNMTGTVVIYIRVMDEGNMVSSISFDLTVSSLITKGDLNRDGNVDFEDVKLGLKVLSLYQNTADPATDVDGDGKITIKDTLYIIQQAREK